MTLNASSLPFTYETFTGGLNTKTGRFLLNDEQGQARDLLNVQSTTDGAIVKRHGLTTLATPAETLAGLFACEETPTPFLLGSGLNTLYSIAPNGTVATIGSGFSGGYNWSWVEAPPVGGQGPVWGMNGFDQVQQWDGFSASTSPWLGSGGTVPLAVPNGTMVVSHANRIWVAGIPAFPSRVSYSSLSAGTMDSTNWSQTAPDDAGGVDFDPGDGEPITGLAVVGPYLLVGKRHKLFVVYDPNTGANRRISANVGIASHRSIASGDDWTYFLSGDLGVYRTNGSHVQYLSDVIQPTMDAIPTGSRAQACGTYFHGHYYLSFPDVSGANNKTLDYDTVLSSWWLHSFGSNQFAVWWLSGEPQLYSAKATAAIVDHCFAPNVYTDNGQPYQWVWRGPWQSPTFYRRRRFPTPYFRKRWRQIRVEGAGHVDLATADNFDATTETPVASLLGGGNADFWETQIYGQGVALAKSLVFSGTSTTAARVFLYSMLITDRKDLVVS